MNKKYFFIIFQLITASLFSQGNNHNCENSFIKIITRSYIKYDKEFKEKIFKIILEKHPNKTKYKDSFDIIIIPVINYKKKTKRKRFNADTTKLLCYLNTHKLYFWEAHIFNNKEYFGDIIVKKSYKNPELVYHYNPSLSYSSFYINKKDCVKFEINNRFDLIFFVDNNKIYYYNKKEDKIYNNLKKLKVTPLFGIWYNKIKYISEKH